MIGTLIVCLLILIFFALFIGNNLSNICNFWFFKTYENIPASVLVLTAFAMGIAFSILVFVIGKVKQSSNFDLQSYKMTREMKKREKMAKMESDEKEFRRKRKNVVNQDSTEAK